MMKTGEYVPREEKEAARALILAAGAVSAGFAEAGPVDAAEQRRFSAWTEGGNNAGMDYLRRHVPLRAHPSSVLENVRTVISAAFSYAPSAVRARELPHIALYAMGEDYHDVLRRRLSVPAERLRERLGGEWRICVDSAPVSERYWALRGGIGRRGRNGCVITEKSGSYVFLAEILTTVAFPPDAASEEICLECGACVRACPAGALPGDGTVDSRRCINYLTIEHRGEWEGESLEAMRGEAGRRSLYGCDICQAVCPHNRGAEPTEIEEFRPREKMLRLTAGEAAAMTQQEFSAFFKGSPVKRAKLAGLLRNARNILS